jgi:hypothetical protein
MRWVELAFGILRREIPGQWNRLHGYIAAAPPDVQEEFFRVLQHMEQQLDRHKRSWRRFR